MKTLRDREYSMTAKLKSQRGQLCITLKILTSMAFSEQIKVSLQFDSTGLFYESEYFSNLKTLNDRKNFFDIHTQFSKPEHCVGH
jgi:hypothetical protein